MNRRGVSGWIIVLILLILAVGAYFIITNVISPTGAAISNPQTSSDSNVVSNPYPGITNLTTPVENTPKVTTSSGEGSSREISTAPLITLTGSAIQTIEAGTAYTELGATTDDGSLVIISGDSVNPKVVGTYFITYNSVDESGNRAVQVTREVDVVDTTAPKITLTGPNPQVIRVETAYNELGATTDDGSTVIPNSFVNTNVVGTYLVTYNAFDASGNHAIQVKREVDVV